MGRTHPIPLNSDDVSGVDAHVANRVCVHGVSKDRSRKNARTEVSYPSAKQRSTFVRIHAVGNRNESLGANHRVFGVASVAVDSCGQALSRLELGPMGSTSRQSGQKERKVLGPEQDPSPSAADSDTRASLP
mgnify:CR=1 FL=1